MKLLYSPNSPYARVARICALHQQVALALEEVSLRERADQILEYNPAAMVPTLVLDNDSFLTETRLVCEYIEDLGSGGFMSRRNDLHGRCREGLANNFLDGIAVWVRELRRPLEEQSPGLLALEKSRATRCFGYFEHHWDMQATGLNYATTMLASAIELVDTRLSLDWRRENPKLADWYEKVSENDLLRLTAPHAP